MLLQRVVELITPQLCISCSNRGGIICDACLPNLASALVGTCVRCNRLTPRGKTCTSCQNHIVIRGVSVASYYDGVVKEMILRLKFHRDRSAARAGAALILMRVDTSTMPFDIVTAVPISPQRYRERGYNQAELIAKEVARSLDLPFRLYLGRNNGDHQLGKDRKTRIEQVRQAFYAQKKIDSLRILIIDDVVTTGATLDACARELKAAGAKNVWGAVVAKH